MKIIDWLVEPLNDNFEYTIIILLILTALLVAIETLCVIGFINEEKRRKKSKEFRKKVFGDIEGEKKEQITFNSTKTTVDGSDVKPSVEFSSINQRRKTDKEEISKNDIENISTAINDFVDKELEKEQEPEEKAEDNVEIEKVLEAKPETKEKEEQNPVIEIKDVCMDFKIATESASGMKDWFIKLVKGKNTHRILHALDHVSFDVYKGEVVGIIGTNGSGKSTLLRIVSGVLNPTSGEVIVDKRKVQLLTLGTGFDMELTARENIYLNGAIIGYSKKFLDDHFDEIVEFAELQDFIDEKVKKFSSGMVSRLGFAIATAGDAAEILILDEVLSVGDEFFRKKSLARIKEMIHGGSTVLMVSHGMGTIKDNCSKVAWIEKGKLMMVGTAKEVCDAYSKQK